MSAVALVERLAALLEYPDGAFHTTLAEACRLANEDAWSAAAELDRFARATNALSTRALQEMYVATFDMNPQSTLDLGWHLYGEAYERGALLALLREELARAGIAERGELPDHLPLVLILLERVSADRRAALAALLAPAFGALQTSLVASGSPYADLVKTVVAAATRGG